MKKRYPKHFHKGLNVRTIRPVRLFLRAKGCYKCTDTQKQIKAGGECPYNIPTLHCAVCRCLAPLYFRVNDDDWQRYIKPDMRESIICRECYNKIKADIDAVK